MRHPHQWACFSERQVNPRKLPIGLEQRNTDSDIAGKIGSGMEVTCPDPEPVGHLADTRG
jgi:hypothetical protein